MSLMYPLLLFILVSFFFFLMKRPPPRSSLFPYTTLFRSIVGAQPVGIFEQAALDAVRHWHYQPVMRDGQAVTQRARVRLRLDRKSTRLNSSHSQISYAVFCLKKKKNQNVLIT